MSLSSWATPTTSDSLPTTITPESPGRFYPTTQLVHDAAVYTSQGQGALKAQLGSATGLVIRRGTTPANSLKVTSSTGLNVSIAAGTALTFHSSRGPCYLELASAQTLLLDASSTLYVFAYAAYDSSNPSAIIDSRETGLAGLAFSGSSTLDGGVLLATVVTGASTITSVTDARVFSDERGKTVTQAGHGFVVGDYIKTSGGAATYAKAQADSAANANLTVGRVTFVPNADTFTYATAGTLITGQSGLTSNTLYYLSATTAGAHTTTAPSTVGQVVKPVFIAISTTEGVFTNNMGTVVVVDPLNRANHTGTKPPTLVTVTATATVATTTDIQQVNLGTGTTQTLPLSVATSTGFVTVKNISTGTVTIAPNTGQTMETGAITSLTTQGSFVRFYLDGTVWRQG